ncbi:MAG: zinc ribbon domain-containing protein, partial [SAR324 cluster bacterium]|nr:zinc ribbon domain-containing protein [SAR324 cluster bacterium]
MTCPHCQHDNREGAAFCGGCGAPLHQSCPRCGSENPPGQKFCDACGQDLSQPSTQSGSSPARRPLSEPATAPASSAGERRQATVLFSDLSGFTAMSEQLDPEEVEGLMRRLKDRAVEIVEAQGGIVSQFVGDEVLALFGIPTAHEDDPVRAVRAALSLHELAQQLSPEVEERIGQPLRMHTGINTGLVVTSTADARDGTVGVTGDTVNIGARLKALAEEDRILLSPATARLVGDFFETEALESAELKGKAAPVTPHRVVGETLARTRFEAAQQRGFTPYIGRERELSQLRRCLENAINGEGQYVTVVGEPGIGKSRLIYELRHEI